MPFEKFINSVPLGVITSERNGDIRSINTFAETMFGYEEGELIGKSIEGLISFNKGSFPSSKLNSLNQRILKDQRIQVNGIKKDGSNMALIVYFSFIKKEEQSNIITFIIDVSALEECKRDLSKMTGEIDSRINFQTEKLTNSLCEIKLENIILEEKVKQKRIAQEQILVSLEKEKELNELKSRFVSMASHEFRTPLAGILSSAELLKSYHEEGNPEALAKHVLKIKKSVQNLTLILDDFLSADKLDQGKVENCPNTFYLQDLVHEVVENLSASCEAAFIVVQHEDHKTMLYQNQHMLQNILINILSNSIKYSNLKDSKIFLKTKVEKGEVLMKIIDSGLGIPIEDQKYLFNRFFRARNVQHIKGTGLGLNIVKRYLELMDGSIDFNSTEGEGTTFSIHFPLEKK